MASLSKIRSEFTDADIGTSDLPTLSDVPHPDDDFPSSMSGLFQNFLYLLTWLILLSISVACWLGLYLIIR